MIIPLLLLVLVCLNLGYAAVDNCQTANRDKSDAYKEGYSAPTT